MLSEEETVRVKAATAWELLVCGDLRYLQQDHQRRTASETRVKLIAINTVLPLWLGILF